MSHDPFGTTIPQDPATQQDTFGNWEQPVDPPKGNGCLKGCLIIAVLLLVIAIGSGWYVSQNWRGMASGFARTVMTQSLEQSDLPAEEQEEIRVQIERLLTEFEEGRLTQDQAERLMQRFAESPLSAVAIAYTIELKYFDESGLSDQEKEEGRMTLRRCVRGLFDGDLTEDDVDPVLGKIATKTDDGGWELPETLTDEELRTFLADAKLRADEVGIPETVEVVDPSDEIKRIVDSVLMPDDLEEPSEENPDASDESPMTAPESVEQDSDEPTPVEPAEVE